MIGKGIVTLVKDLEEKRVALNLIMEHYSGKDNWALTDEAIDKAVVIRLDVAELSCKEHI